MNNSFGKAKKVMMLGLDGADAMLLKRYLDEGKLPNFKKFIEAGVTTKSLGMQGQLPTITPPGWATLATGAWPGTHGITDFWNHTLGKELDLLDYGFDSTLCEAEFIWDAFRRGGKKSIIFNYPTSWPPTNKDDIFIDGTGIFTNLRGYLDYETKYECIEGDFPIEEIPVDSDTSGTDCRIQEEVAEQKAGVKYDGWSYDLPDLETDTEEADAEKCDRVKTPIKPASNWSIEHENAKEVVLPVNSGKTRRYGLIVAEDGTNYNKLQIFVSKKDQKPIGEARVNEWSDWIYDVYNHEGEDKPVAYKIKIIELAPDGSKLTFYYSFALDLKSSKYFYPSHIGAELYEKLGPCMQPSNYDRHNVAADTIVMETMEEFYQWEADAINYVLDNYEWDLFYTHIHGIDMVGHYYIDSTLEGRKEDFERYCEYMYKVYEMSDRYLGKLMKRLDDQTAIIITSDHGLVTHKVEPPELGDMWGMNVGVMKELGYTKLKEVNGQLEIDWENTQAVAQRSCFIYLNLKGRDPQGIVDPQDYDELVEKIISDLYNYRDPKTGRRIVSFALNKKDMEVIGLGGPHCGDIAYFLEPDWNRHHGNGLSSTSVNDYSLEPIFMMAGAGIKKGEIIKRRVRAIDIVPTICHLAGAPVPRDAEGGVIFQALKE